MLSCMYIAITAASFRRSVNVYGTPTMCGMLYRPHYVLVPGMNTVFKVIWVEFDDSFHGSCPHIHTRKI